MVQTRHPKISEFIAKSSPLMERAAMYIGDDGKLQQREITLGDDRVVKGYAVLWRSVNSFREQFIKGAFARSIRENGPGSGAAYEIKFLFQHKRDKPLVVFAKLVEDESGLYFETEPLPKDADGDFVWTRIKNRSLNNFSIGFDYVYDKLMWDDVNEVLIVQEARLYEISVVTIPSDMETFAVRSLEADTVDEMARLKEDIQLFIRDVPQRLKGEARELFTRLEQLTPSPSSNNGTRADAPPVQEGEKDNPETSVLDLSYATRMLGGLNNIETQGPSMNVDLDYIIQNLK